MSGLSLIVRATRASASALAAMARHARTAEDATHQITLNRRAEARGYVPAGTYDRENETLRSARDTARDDYRKAHARYMRARGTLANNPLPGDQWSGESARRRVGGTFGS
jgi:hypothetical protein